MTLRALFASLALATLPAAALADKPPASAKVSKAPRSFASKPANGTRARCAVSGEEFTVSDKTQVAQHDGRTYVFCCSDCKPEFEGNPKKFADPK